MSKAIGRIYGVGTKSPYGYETDYMKYLQGYNPYDYEQTLRNMSQPYADISANPEYNYIPQVVTNQNNYNGSELVLQPDTLTNQGVQYAQNNVANITTDANYTQPVDYSLYGDDFSKEFIDQMLNDLRFQQVMMNRTQENEGGYSNHPNDRGGETRYGISSRWYPDEDIANLTRERANAILYRDYWLKPHINKLPDEFADIVFDDGVVQGQPTAIKNLQRALGTHADGIIGPNTLSAFENANYNTVRRNFIRNVNNVEDEYLRNDPSQRVFEKGHRDRFNKY